MEIDFYRIVPKGDLDRPFVRAFIDFKEKVHDTFECAKVIVVIENDEKLSISQIRTAALQRARRLLSRILDELPPQHDEQGH